MLVANIKKRKATKISEKTRIRFWQVASGYTVKVLINAQAFIRIITQACHNFFVKKPKIFENVKSERAAANFQKSQTPRASTIISKNSQI